MCVCRRKMATSMDICQDSKNEMRSSFPDVSPAPDTVCANAYDIQSVAMDLRHVPLSESYYIEFFVRAKRQLNNRKASV